jgi:hypothetical protein
VTTLLGNVVHEAISLVGRALEFYWVLKAIESFQKPSAIKSKEVMSKLIDSLNDDQVIRKIIMDPPILLDTTSQIHLEGKSSCGC